MGAQDGRAGIGQAVRPPAVLGGQRLDQAARLEPRERAYSVPGPRGSPVISRAAAMIA